MQYDTIILDELSPDSSDYEHDGLEQATNAIPVQSSWREIKGRRVLAVTPAIPADVPLASFSSYGDPATVVGYIGSVFQIYGFHPTTFFSGYSKGGGPYPASLRWNFTKFGNTVIAASSNGAIPLQGRVGAAATFVDIATSVDRPTPQQVGVVRSVVVGSNLLGGAAAAGVYAGVTDPQQFCWCARNNVADWQVNNTNGAGFGYLKGPGGPINALVCYQSYALAFQAYSVNRLDYTGDSNGFQPSEIASGGLGIPTIRSGGRGAVKAGGDVFYLRRSSVPASSTTARPASSSAARRSGSYLSDMLSDYGASTRTQPIEGTYDPYLGAGGLDSQAPQARCQHRNPGAHPRGHRRDQARLVRRLHRPLLAPGGTLGHDRAGLRDAPTSATFSDLSGAQPLLPARPAWYMVEWNVAPGGDDRLVNFQDQPRPPSCPSPSISKIWHPLAGKRGTPSARARPSSTASDRSGGWTSTAEHFLNVTVQGRLVQRPADEERESPPSPLEHDHSQR
jgi:hypothetical protein